MANGCMEETGALNAEQTSRAFIPPCNLLEKVVSSRTRRRYRSGRNPS